ncbi:hypothetical protein [Parasegetibacter sp. NRK P23]|uniref:hypothetical protein n=1 Tax=Parasegetibacter sp. NRK P23 TaxID=2942999 RepID=UPI002042CC81|nr:hypothetical protein [Parasegetibacter sp. NRK P23]MCM5528986.1 hypothetical protein [Parasegetibacter sp. NRK P23]
MLSFEEIDKSLVYFNQENLPDNYVAAAVKLDENGSAFHAGILICFEATYYILHFDGNTVDFKSPNLSSWYFHKPLSIILSDEVETFRIHCLMISETANPEQGYFFAGSYYDSDGKWYSKEGFPERMTCVGFCISVIMGFLDSHTYIQFEDWDSKSIGDDEYFKGFIRNFKLENADTEIDEELYRKNMRRIPPPEFLASAFFDNLPIRKSQIDEIIDHITLSLKFKFKALAPGSLS